VDVVSIVPREEWRETDERISSTAPTAPRVVLVHPQKGRGIRKMDDTDETTNEQRDWYWGNTGEERVKLPIPDGVRYDIDDLKDGTIVVQWWVPIGKDRAER
jgi:hypothetical protein